MDRGVTVRVQAAQLPKVRIRARVYLEPGQTRAPVRRVSVAEGCEMVHDVLMPALDKAGTGWPTATLRWLWGADDDSSPHALITSAPVTWVLLFVVLIVSVLDFALASSLTEIGPLTDELGISPAGVGRGQWWRLVTTAFVNPPEFDPPLSGLQHVLANAIPMVLVGPRIERAFGSKRFALLLAVATVCAAVSLYVGAPFYWTASGGTSGAVYGLIGATVVTAIAWRRRSKSDAIFMGAVVAILVLLVLPVPALPAGTNLSHFGGFVAGAVIAAAWCSHRIPPRTATLSALVLLVLAVSVAGSRTAGLRASDIAFDLETPLGFRPVMITPGFGSLWVTSGRVEDEDDDLMVRIDPATGGVTARFDEKGIGGLPVATADRVWAAANGFVVGIDPERDRVVERIELDGEAWPWSLAATKDALWAAVSDPGQVIRIDLRSKEQKVIAVGAASFVVSAHGSNVWATSYGAKTVSRLDSATGEVVARAELETEPYQTLFLDGSLWVGAQSHAYRLHPETLEEIARVEVGGQTWTIAPDGVGEFFISDRYARSIVRVDPEGDEVDRRFSLGLRQPISFAVVGDDLWIADAFEGSILRATGPAL